MRAMNWMSAAIVGASAIAMSSLTTPAVAAPPVVQNPAACAAVHPRANCLNRGPGNPGRYYGYVPPHVYNYGGAGYPRSSFAYYPAYRTGFAPLDFAGDVVGATIGTAGAIASAPLGPYAWDYE